MKQNQKKQHGYTIVEILIGVIVAAIVIAGIYVGWNSFYSSNQASTVTTDMTQIVQNTQTMFQSSGDYSTLKNEVAISGGVFPADLRITGASVKNAFGGDVTLTPAADTSTFTLTYAALPASVCQKVISSLNTANLIDISVGETSVWSTGKAFPDGATIATACASSEGSSSVSLAVTAR